VPQAFQPSRRALLSKAIGSIIGAVGAVTMAETKRRRIFGWPRPLSKAVAVLGGLVFVAGGLKLLLEHREWRKAQVDEAEEPDVETEHPSPIPPPEPPPKEAACE